jgi:hypothetical protein
MNTGGLSKARIGRMHDIIAGCVERGEVPGIIMLVNRRGEVHVDTIGMKSFGGSDPIRRAWTSPSPPDVCLDFWTTAYQAIDD